MLRDMIRRVIPIKYRQDIGLWTIEQASRSKLLLYPYLYALCGSIPKNLRILQNQECSVNYMGHNIVSPRDGVLAFIEVLQDKAYEKYYSPKSGDIVIDVGAYVGMFTVKASLQVGLGIVVAIEPASSNIEYLRKNTKHLANVTIVPVAAGSSTSKMRLTISKASPCCVLENNPSGVAETVEVDTLDNIIFQLGIEKVDFIKIDAEGFELEVLKGASNTLKNNKLRLAVASYHNLPTGEYELPYVKRLLASAGFRIRIIKEYVYAEKGELDG